jgi:hypothetical protein
LRWSY